MTDKTPLGSEGLLRQLADLNKKIDHLKLVTNRNTNDEGQKARFSLDFIDSERLQEIESGIKETVRGVVLSKVAVCKALANIDKKNLYIQEGYENFMQYLSAERIPLKYKTAKEYAKIGDTIVRHEERLREVDFHEEDGLKKLIFLDTALKNHKGDPGQVYKKVKELSLRDFQKFAGRAKPVQPMLTEEQFLAAEGGDFTFEAADATIYRCSGNGRRVAVLKVIDPQIGSWKDGTSFPEFLERLRRITEEYYSGKPDKG